MIELGIDEITLVLQLSPIQKHWLATTEWQEMAESIVSGFEEKSNFVKVFGKRSMQTQLPQGYTKGYAYGIDQHDFYPATIAYHPNQLSMGVIVKFSAQALDYYSEKTGFQVYEFLQSVEYDILYTIRLSRIDCVCDYIDEDINVTEIYQSLIDNRVAVFREYLSNKTMQLEFRRHKVEISGIVKGEDVPTVYLGSVHSNARLRIYDKKIEQLERKGNKLDKARKCRNWVRFELVLRHEYSHQLGKELAKIHNNDDFANLIAHTIIQKFCFKGIDDGVVDCETIYSQLLLDCITNRSFNLKAPSSRNYDLSKSCRYIFFGSGAVSTLYKIKEIFGTDGLSKFISILIEYVLEWKPNDDCRIWLSRNKEDYKSNYPDFDDFSRDNIQSYL